MDTDMKARIIRLLETYREREMKIALLHYKLQHPPNISPDEMIDTMSFGHSNGTSHSKGHISNKTLYIALNYQDKTDKVNSDAMKEVVDRLVELEHEQERLVYYVSLLEAQEASVIRRFYFEGQTWESIAQEIFVALRTVYKIKNRALDRLAKMYAYADQLT